MAQVPFYAHMNSTTLGEVWTHYGDSEQKFQVINDTWKCGSVETRNNGFHYCQQQHYPQILEFSFMMERVSFSPTFGDMNFEIDLTLSHPTQHWRWGAARADESKERQQCNNVFAMSASADLGHDASIQLNCSRVHATLQPTLSVGRSICPSVSPSVHLSVML